jgi:hypothetical protein
VPYHLELFVDIMTAIHKSYGKVVTLHTTHLHRTACQVVCAMHTRLVTAIHYLNIEASKESSPCCCIVAIKEHRCSLGPWVPCQDVHNDVALAAALS